MCIYYQCILQAKPMISLNLKMYILRDKYKVFEGDLSNCLVVFFF